MTKQCIVKWGNSLAFRVPAAVAKQMGVAEGVEVTYSLQGRQLVVEASEPEMPSFTKDDFAKALPKAKRASRMVSFGKPRGQEEW